MTRTRHVTLALVGLLLAGCQAHPPGAGVGPARDAYQRGDYAGAYAAAKPVADGFGPQSQEASFLAGLSAYQLRNGSEAETYLYAAARSDDRQLAGDALASLGRLYGEQGRHDRAVASYAAAAPKLTGRDKANAFYYTALSQQHLGQWPQARHNLLMARNSSSDAEFRKRVDEQLRVHGWTIQVGAYANESNARQAAQSLAHFVSNLRLGEPRLVPAVDPSGKRLILVQFGQFSNEAGANAVKSRIPQTSVVVPMMMAAAR